MNNDLSPKAITTAKKHNNYKLTRVITLMKFVKSLMVVGEQVRHGASERVIKESKKERA